MILLELFLPFGVRLQRVSHGPHGPAHLHLSIARGGRTRAPPPPRRSAAARAVRELRMFFCCGQTLMERARVLEAVCFHGAPLPEAFAENEIQIAGLVR